jgi:tRNA (guanine37-N1)-methyltransferase
VWFGIVTLFPAMFGAIANYGITRRAVERGLVTLQYWDPRSFTHDRHGTVDDRPYGGGPGMIMKALPLREAIQAARSAAPTPPKVVYLSPQGPVVTQKHICQTARHEHTLILVCGRYEGVDERVLALEVDEEWSIGDYVLSGGELAAMVVIDAVTRWLPGALGHESSAALDSFADRGLLGCPQYTRPERIENLFVPEVLRQGDHAAIESWRLQQRLGRTWLRRPEWLQTVSLNPQETQLLEAFIRDYQSRSIDTCNEEKRNEV